MLFFVLPDQNTFHALNVFFFSKSKLDKRHIISTSFLKSFRSTFIFSTLSAAFHVVHFYCTSQSLIRGSHLDSKSRLHNTGEKRKGKIYIQSLTGLWALVQCRGIDKEFNVHQNGWKQFQADAPRNGRSGLSLMHHTSDSPVTHLCTVMVMTYQQFSDRCTTGGSSCKVLGVARPLYEHHLGDNCTFITPFTGETTPEKK